MSDRRRSARLSLFPELRLFEDRKVRSQAFRQARNRVLLERGRWLLILACIVTSGICAGLLGFWMKTQLGLRTPWLNGALGAIAGAATVWVAHFLFRRPVQRHLRERLRALGVPVCLVCGYNLRGNLSGRCPECGTRTDDARTEPDLE
jgi:hypothetical protein